MAGLSWADEPVPVPAGAGSYASFPPAQEDEGRHGEKVAQMATRPIYIDTALADEPVPTNQWWTSLIIDKYSGTMWAYPFVVAAFSKGYRLFLPMGWNAQGTDMQTGPALEILGDSGSAAAASADRVLADFEGDTYPGGWSGWGAFGDGPAKGGFPNQTRVGNFLGQGLVNSFLPDDAAEGSLTSGEFVIDRKYLKFLIGGGKQPNDLYIRLLVEGKEVRRSTGRNSEFVEWDCWDVAEFAGKKATLEITDNATGGWGHILVDQIVLSDHLPTKDDAGDATTFSPESAAASRWSDWLVQAREKAVTGESLEMTFGHGFPYVWIESHGVSPVIKLPAGAVVTTLDGAALPLPATSESVAITVEGRTFAIFVPAGTRFEQAGNLLRVSYAKGAPAYLSVGAAGAGVDLKALAAHARMIPRETNLSWIYDPARGRVETTWTIKGEPLEGSVTSFLQGWLPHHYRQAENDLKLAGLGYATPRGLLRCAEGNEFHIAFPFEGLLPNPPFNAAAVSKEFPWDEARMSYYLNGQADKADYGGDTYWGGKDIMRYGQYLAIAAQTRNPAFAALKKRLRGAMEDWFTYTPGEKEHYFARYDRWKALIGFNDSYGSFQFTDNHFHYGYFTATSALLGIFDPDFVSRYRPMMEMVAKQYANWDPKDKNFPRFRTFDIWAGHSHAGGFSGPGGNNQESSSEAMQSWGGLFLLGAVIRSDGMRDAGAMGFAMERAAVMQYWMDDPGWKNKAESVFPAGYRHTIVGILFDGGQAFATYFSGDPGWIYGIQWLPVSPIIEYLAEDPVFAKWQDDQMMAARQAWQEDENARRPDREAKPNTITGMGNALGNVILGYRALYDPTAALRESDQQWSANSDIGRDLSQGGLVYYYAHAYLQLGTRLPGAHGSIPTSAVYCNAQTKVKSYVAYNPGDQPVEVVFSEGGRTVGKLTVPAGLTISATTLKL